MKRQTGYELLAAVTLAIAGGLVVLAVAGAALQQTMSVAAASLCAFTFLVPGLCFLAYGRRLRARDIALVHAAAFATARGTLEVEDLASELRVSREDAEKILRTAVREGHLAGDFDERGRFVAVPKGTVGRP